MDRTTESTRSRGVDGPPENRPGVPMETNPAHERSPSGGPSDRQPERKPHLRSPDRELTHTFGTGPAPRAASGAMRRAAYAMPEHQARRWMLLMAADRVDVLERRLPELATGRTWDQLGRQVRANPVGMLTLAMGVGFVLERTRLLQTLGGAVASAVLSNGMDEESRTDAEEKLLEWLNDAYAMEKALIPVLENHANDARRHPDVRERDLQHLEETKQHAKAVKKCIKHLGGSPSASKKMIGRMTGAVNSIATEPFEDEILKNFLMDYATENFEIACYRSLIVAANEAGHPKIADICEEILQDEIDMAEWIEDNLPEAVRLTLR